VGHVDGGKFSLAQEGPKQEAYREFGYSQRTLWGRKGLEGTFSGGKGAQSSQGQDTKEINEARSAIRGTVLSE